MHAQQPVLGRSLDNTAEYYSSPHHRVTTFDDEANSRIADDHPHMSPHDFVRPTDAMESPTTLRAHIRKPSDATSQSLIASSPFGNMSFGGDSANLFYPAGSIPYPEQPMGSIGNKPSIKVEGNQDHGWYGRFSTMTEPGTSHVQVVGAYPPYPLPGQHADVHAEAQCMHTWSDSNEQKSWTQTAVPVEGADRGWTGHHARSEIFPGMNSHHPANTEWSSSWIYQGY